MNQAFFDYATKLIEEMTDEELAESLKAAGFEVTVRQYPEQEETMATKQERFAIDCINEQLMDLISDINDISNETGYVLPPEQLAKIEEVHAYLNQILLGPNAE